MMQTEDQRVSEILKRENKSWAKRQFSILGDFWNFMKVRKKWWLLPIIITLVLIGVLIIFGQASPLSPFIYALF
jgi:hypothetical protein